jgi:hypothetical protein
VGDRGAGRQRPAAAAGAAWALGIGPEIIRTGLETFTIA